MPDLSILATPYTLCVLAVTAAAVAAAFGHHMRPSVRRQRQSLRALRTECRALEAKIDAERARYRQIQVAIAGRLAVHDGEALYLRMLADHPELYRTPDVQSGGA